MRSRVSERYQAGKHRPHEPRFPKRELGGKSGAGSGLVVGLERQPGIGWRIGFEILLHDTGHGERPFVEEDGSSHNARVAAEAALPGAVGENRGAWPAGQVLGAVENPTQRGCCAKDLEELLGDMQGLELNGRISTA